MKKTIKLITNIASVVIGIPFILVVLSLWYDGYIDKRTYPEFYNNIHKDRVSLEEVNDLLEDTTKDFPYSGERSEYKRTVLVAVTKYYYKPTDDMFDLLTRDIEKKQVWSKIESYSKKKTVFCNGQYELEIGKDANNKGVGYLRVDVGWYADGQCRRQYYNIPIKRMSFMELL